MGRHIWSIVALVGVLFWLFFSYVPSALPATARFSASLRLPGGVLRSLAVLSLLLFVGIQLWLLNITVHLRSAFAQHRKGVDGAQRGPRVQLYFSIELFWTSLPLLITLGMAYISYQTWLSLSTR